MAEHQLPKLVTRVRFPSLAPYEDNKKDIVREGAVAQLTDQVSYSDSSFLLHKNMKTLASSTPARVLVV